METRRRTLVQGLVAGLIGYGAIAAFFAVVNLASGRPLLSTARLLGGGLVAPGVADAVPAAPVLAYNAVHLAILLAVGMAAAWLLREAERHPRAWLLLFLAGLLALFFLEMAFVTSAAPAAPSLPVWATVGANVLAALGIGGYLLRGHPGLVRRLESSSSGA